MTIAEDRVSHVRKEGLDSPAARVAEAAEAGPDSLAERAVEVAEVGFHAQRELEESWDHPALADIQRPGELEGVPAGPLLSGEPAATDAVLQAPGGADERTRRTWTRTARGCVPRRQWLPGHCA